jgi:Leucine-rich repeat (LRR) protein
MLAFKKGINGDPAGILASWQEGEQEDCCRWRGVRCSNRTGHVLKLQLRNDPCINIYGDTVTPLVGQISRSLLKLESLEYLYLSCNELDSSTGRVPEFLGSLRNLKYVNLSSIQSLGPPVPPHLGNLSKLQYLDLSNMALGYTYQTDLSWLAHLSSLEYLNLEGVF